MSTRFFSKKSVIVIILIISSFAVYLNTLHNGFVYDDNVFVLQNPWVKDISRLSEVFTSPVMSFLTSTPAKYYRPVYFLVYMVEYQIFGFKPWGWHLTNVILHTLNAVMVFLVAGMFFSRRSAVSDGPFSGREGRVLLPFFASVIFLTHPVNTEAVNWIGCVPELLFTFFYLLSLYLYVLGREISLEAAQSAAVVQGRPRSPGPLYVFSAFSFVIALLSKETAFTLPVLFVIYDYVEKTYQSKGRSSLKAYIPYAAGAVFYLALRFYAFRGMAGRGGHLNDIALTLLNVLPLFADNMAQLLFPFKQSPFHVFNRVGSFMDLRLILPAVVVAAAALGLRALRKVPGIVISAALILLPLIPTFYLLFSDTATYSVTPLADRYLYLSSAGFAMIVSSGLVWFFLGRKTKSRKMLFCAVGVILLIYVPVTVRRRRVWENDRVLWTSTVKSFPDNYYARFMLAGIYMDENRYDEAEAETLKSIRANPGFAGSHQRLGRIWYRQGRAQKALEEFRKVIQINPKISEPYYNIAVIYMDRGKWGSALRELKQALKYARDASRLLLVHNALAVTYANLGNLKETRAQLMEALKIDKGDRETLENMKYLKVLEGG